MKNIVIALAFSVTIGFAHNSYTGGYSGAPGRQACSSSCHGGTSGSLVVTGFPASYQPLQTYRIVIRRNGGNPIVNFNATTRVGATTTVAGTFAVLTNTAVYAGTDGGVYANPHSIDSAVFQWTAPAGGTGTVNFYASGFQGTTTSSNGQSTKISLSATESLTGVAERQTLPTSPTLLNNYPNPFNPSTTIRYELPRESIVRLAVYDMTGAEVAVLVNDRREAGVHEARFDASALASGVYFYRITAGQFVECRKMVLLR